MQKLYILVVRDKISTSEPNKDNTLKNLECYYESPTFISDGTWQSIDKAIDKFYHHFKHFINWTVTSVEIQ